MIAADNISQVTASAGGTNTNKWHNEVPMNGTVSGDWSQILRKPAPNCWEFPGRRQVRCWVGGGRRGSRSQGRPRENLEAVDSTQVLDRSPWLQTAVCSMCTWPRVPPLHGAGDRDTEVVRLGRSSWSGGHLFPQHGNRFPSSPMLQIQSSELGMGTLVPAVLLCYCDQHLSPIGNCVTVVLL